MTKCPTQNKEDRLQETHLTKHYIFDRNKQILTLHIPSSFKVFIFISEIFRKCRVTTLVRSIKII